MKTYRPINPSDPIEANVFRAANRSDPHAQYDVLYAEPSKVLPGMLVLADGSTWNPGSGAGLYLRNAANTAWISLAGTGGGVGGAVFRAYLSTSNQSVSSGVYTKINLNAEDFDTRSRFDTSTGTYTPNVAGYYYISWCVNGASSGTTTQVQGLLYKNGSSYADGSFASPVTTDGLSVGATVVYMNGTTDYLELYGFVVSSSSPIVRKNSNLTYLAGAYLGSGSTGGDSGPCFSAQKSGTQSIGAAHTKVTLTTEDWDTNSCYDAVNSKFTPDVAGYYQITGRVSFTSSSSGNTVVSVYKNGATDKPFLQLDSNAYVYGASGLVYMNGSTDYLELYCYSATTRTADAASFQGFLARPA